MTTLIKVVLVAIYCVWSIRLGFRFVDGRWATLEAPNMKPIKMIISIVLGLSLGIFLIVARIIKFIFCDLPRLLG